MLRIHQSLPLASEPETAISQRASRERRVGKHQEAKRPRPAMVETSADWKHVFWKKQRKSDKQQAKREAVQSSERPELASTRVALPDFASLIRATHQRVASM